MKQILRGILTNSVAIALVAFVLPGVQYEHQLSTLITAAIVLGITNTFIKPIVQLILLPVNIVTLGIAGLFINAVMLFLTTLIVPAFNIVPFTLPWGSTTLSITIIWSYIICSVALSVVAGFIRNIVNS